MTSLRSLLTEEAETDWLSSTTLDTIHEEKGYHDVYHIEVLGATWQQDHYNGEDQGS